MLIFAEDFVSVRKAITMIDNLTQVVHAGPRRLQTST